MIVLFGGQSAEHDVSCVSAVSVLRALDPEKYVVQGIGITKDGLWVESAAAAAIHAGNAIGELRAEGAPIERAEALAFTSDSGPAEPGLLPIVLPILHGPFGEDGTVQGLLELAGVPFVGSGVLGSAVAMDKSVAKELFRSAGLPQAKWLARASWDVGDPAAMVSFTREVGAQLGWPVFVKPANLGSSVGVSKVAGPDEFARALTTAFGYDDWIIVEEAIRGREIEFALLGNECPEVSVAGEVVPGHEFHDYEDKYLEDSARHIIPAALPADARSEGQQLAIAAYRALRCEGMARVDFFFDDGSTGGDGRGWVVNEVNTIPGFTPMSMYPKLWAATGVSYPQLIDRLVALAASRHERRSGRVGRARGLRAAD